jgi:hypothetical protein
MQKYLHHTNAMLKGHQQQNNKVMKNPRHETLENSNSLSCQFERFLRIRLHLALHHRVNKEK